MVRIVPPLHRAQAPCLTSSLAQPSGLFSESHLQTSAIFLPYLHTVSPAITHVRLSISVQFYPYFDIFLAHDVTSYVSHRCCLFPINIFSIKLFKCETQAENFVGRSEILISADVKPFQILHSVMNLSCISPVTTIVNSVPPLEIPTVKLRFCHHKDVE